MVTVFFALFLCSMQVLGAQDDRKDEDPETVARSLAEMDQWAQAQMGSSLTLVAGSILEDQEIMVSRLDLAGLVLKVATVGEMM